MAKIQSKHNHIC